jgi:ubiquitin-protein ligase
MTARLRRLISDWEQIKKEFSGHRNIIVTPIGSEPPEKYHVTYFVNGISLLPDGRIETVRRHEAEIILHADYPRYKPICKILTPIWHPNFRDGQICIGDIWGAGETLSDIIINIGDMIQYKSWNSYSPLSADSAKWAIENKYLFPIGNIELRKADYTASKEKVEIDLFSEDQEADIQPEWGMHTQSLFTKPEPGAKFTDNAAGMYTEPLYRVPEPDTVQNDIEITAGELAGIEFIPTAQKMQTLSHGDIVKSKKVNFKTVLVKGIIWAFLGAFLGFGIGEFTGDATGGAAIAKARGYELLSDYFRYADEAVKAYTESDFDAAQAYNEKSSYALEVSYTDEFYSSDYSLEEAVTSIMRTSTAIWFAIIALFVGLFLGIGEGVYYGSKEKAVKYALIGAGVSVVIGFISGYIAQWMYYNMLSDTAAFLQNAFIRGIGWAVMGIGAGLAIGIIKPEKKRVLYCGIGGLAGAFVGGFLFDYICASPLAGGSDVSARGIAIIVMGLLIGLGVGLLEQVAKAAWLKVVRGEFEGKEYLVFAGTTSIGNNGKNTIVLFKDKLVGPNHCDIVLEGSKYVLVDKGTPMGTVVNGQRIVRHVLRKGDAIAIGNSVLVFNTK